VSCVDSVDAGAQPVVSRHFEKTMLIYTVKEHLHNSSFQRLSTAEWLVRLESSSCFLLLKSRSKWIPAFAGMTKFWFVI
jgi:hypothetical protein